MVYGLQCLNNKSILGEAFKRLSKRSTLPKSAFSWKEKIENKNVKKYARVKVWSVSMKQMQWNESTKNVNTTIRNTTTKIKSIFCIFYKVPYFLLDSICKDGVSFDLDFFKTNILSYLHQTFVNAFDKYELGVA